MPVTNLHDLQKPLSFVERTVIPGATFARVAREDVTRLGIYFHLPNPGGGPLSNLLSMQVQVTTNKAALLFDGFTVNSLQSLLFNFQVWGPIVQAEWLARQAFGTPSLTIVEVFYRPKGNE